MKFFSSLCMLIFFAGITQVTAQTIDVGNHEVSQNGTTTIDFFVTGLSLDVSGLNLIAQIGDGTAGPVFSALGGIDNDNNGQDDLADLLTGTPFSGGTQGENTRELRLLEYTASTPSGQNVSLVIPQKIATIKIDGAGSSNGRYGLSLGSINILGFGTANSDFTRLNLTNFTPTILNGSIAIGANPEVIWSGGSSTADLLSFDNWLYQAAPLTGDSLHFAGSVGTTVTFNQDADLDYNSITFDSGASSFTLTGNSIGLLASGAGGTATGTITNESGSPQNIELDITLAASASNTFDAKAGDLNYTGTIALGAGGTLIFTDSDTVTATNTNNVAGNITGTGTVQNTAGILNLAGTNTFGTLDVTGGTVNLNGDSAMSDTGLVNITNGVVALNADETIGSLAGIGGTVDLQTFSLTTGDAADTNFAGAITDSGGGGLTKQGDGNFTLSGTNTFTGGVTLNAGTLTLVGGSALADTVTVTQAVGSVLALSDNETIGALAGTGSVTLGANTLGIGGTVNTAYAGVISGTGGLTKQGAGNFTLSGTNTFTGPINITAGTLSVSNEAAIVDTVAVTADGTLFLNNDETIGDLAGTGTVNNNGNALTFGNTASTTFFGDIAGSGAVNYVGSGTFAASGVNTFSGPLTISNGTVNLTGSALNSNTLNVTGGTLRANNVGGGNALSDAAVVTVTGTSSLQVDNAETTGEVDIAATATLTLSNTLTLSGANTSTMAGTASGSGSIAATNNALLQLSGTSTSSITANTNGTLDLTGSVSNVIVDSTGTLATGVGTINTASSITGNLVVNAGGILAVDISNSTGTLTQDVFTVTGNATFADNSIIAINDAGPTAIVTGNSFNFLTYGGTLTATQQNVGVLDQVKLQESLSDVAFQLTDAAGTLTLTAVTVTNVTWDGDGNDGLWSTATNWDDDTNGVTFNNTASATFDLEGKGIIFSGATNNGGIVNVNVNADNGGTVAATSYSNIASIGFTSTAGSFALTGLDLNLINDQTVDISNDSANSQSIANNIITGDTTTTIAANTANLTFSGTLTNNGGIAVTGVKDTSVTGTITGNGSLTKTGSGMLTLNTANTYVGPTTVNSGTLAIGTIGSVTSNVTVAGGTLSLANDAAINANNTLTLNGGTLSLTGGALPITVANATTIGGDVTLTGNNVDFTNGVNLGSSSATHTLAVDTNTIISGVLSGSNNLVKTGLRVLTLSGENTHTGNITVNVGDLTLDKGSAVGDNALLTNNGTGDVMFLASETIGALAGSGGLDLQNSTLTLAGSQTADFSGIITNVNGNGNILFTGSGTQTLSGINTYTGDTTVSSIATATGTLAITGSVAGNVYLQSGLGTLLLGSASVASDKTLNLATANLGAATDGATIASSVNITGNTNITGSNALNLSGTVDLNGGTRILTTADAANITTLSGIISDGGITNGGITKAGSGQLVLSGVNTFAGGTTLNAGTLTLGNNAALGSGTLTLSGGTLASNDDARNASNAVTVTDDFALGGSNNLTLSGNVDLSGGDADHAATVTNTTTLSGNLTGGDLTKAGTGEVTLSGINDFTTGLTVNAGTVNLSSSTALDAVDNLTITGGTVNVNNTLTVADLSGTVGVLNLGAGLTFGDATNAVLASTITETAGAWTLTKNGIGTQTLTGDNTFTGGTTINVGGIAVGHNNALGTGVLTLNNGTMLDSALNGVSLANNITLTADSTINADASLDMTLSGIISGGFAVNKTGPGTLQLQGVNTFNTLNLTEGNVILNNASASNALADTAAVNITGGSSILQLNHNETIGSLAGTGGTVSLQTFSLTTGDDNDTSFAGALTGTGGLTKQGTGNFTLSGTNTFTGAVALTAGTLTLSGANALADTVSVTQTDGSVLALSNDETFGALAGDGSVTLGANTLGLGGSIDTTYAGVISDGGSGGGLNYNSTGTLTLSGINTFTGVTNINSGTINLDGTALGNNVLTGNVNVSGGSLTGNGNIGGDLNILSGLLSPGNSAGTIHVGGNFSLAGGAMYLAQIDYAGTGNATTVDLLAVTGNLTIANGGILKVALVDPDKEAVEGDKHILATSNAITDNGLTIDEPALIDLSYTTIDGNLEITIVNLLNFEEATANSVNPAVGTALVTVAGAADNGNADAQDLLNALDNLTETQLNTFVEQVNNSADGSSLSTQTVSQLVQTFNQVLANHLASRRSNMPVYAQQSTRSQLSMLAGLTDNPYTLAQVAANEQNAPQQDEQVRLAMPLNEWAAFGKIYGIFSNQNSTSSRTGYLSNGIGAQFGMDYQINENWLVGMAFDYTRTDVTVDSGLGSIDVDSVRIGPFASYFNDKWYVDLNLTYSFHSNDSVRNIAATGPVDAKYNAYDVSTYIGGGYKFKLNEAWTLTPTASMRYTYYNRESYSESGVGALNYSTYDTSSLYSRLGTKLTYQLKTMDVLFIPEMVLGWEHEYLNDQQDVSAAFTGGGAFSIRSGNIDLNSVFFGMGLTAIIKERWTTFFRYEGSVSENGDTHIISGGLRFNF